MLGDFATVGEDLAFLGETFRPGVDDRSLRHGSAILRRFLVDGGQGILFSAWRAAGFEGQPRIMAPDLLALVGGRFDGVEIALAGAGEMEGMTVGGIVMFDGPTPRHPKDYSGEGIMERQWPLLEYISAPVAYVHGETVSRRALVKLFANHLGGVHLNVSGKVRRKDEAEARRLQKIRQTVNVYHKDGLLFELMAIGQALSSSDDLQKLQSALLG